MLKEEKSKKVHCYFASLGLLHFRGWKWRGGERTITGSGEIENLKRTTHRSENLLSLIALPKEERGRRRKDAIRNLPYLLPAASTNWPICQENSYFSQNEKKIKRSEKSANIQYISLSFSSYVRSFACNFTNLALKK